MNRETIVDFISDIFVPFSLLLYEKSNKNEAIDCEAEFDDEDYMIEPTFSYPDCCKLASNIISTFLNLVSDEHFDCCYSTQARYSHSWCQSNNLDIVIDITGFQFDDDIFRKSKFHEIHQKKYTEQELQDILNTRDYIFTISEYRKRRMEYFLSPCSKIPDTVLMKSGYSLDRDSFLSFLDSNFETFKRNEELMNY